MTTPTTPCLRLLSPRERLMVIESAKQRAVQLRGEAEARFWSQLGAALRHGLQHALGRLRHRLPGRPHTA